MKKMFIVLPLAFLFAFQAIGAEWSLVELQYRYKVAERLRYRLGFHHQVELIAEGKRTQGSIKRAFEYLQETQSIGAGTEPATLSVQFEHCAFDAGDPTKAFDSRNPEQVGRVKSNPDWAVWGALLSSRSRARVGATGKVAFFRVTEIDKDFDEKTSEIVKRVLEDNFKYFAAPLPGTKIKMGESWNGAIPVRFVGGMLGANIIHLDGRFTLERIDIVKGERTARIRVELNTQPSLDLTEDSLKGGKVDFRVETLQGQLLFSLDRGNIIKYSVLVRTHFRLLFGTQVLDDNRMNYEFKLERL